MPIPMIDTDDTLEYNVGEDFIYTWPRLMCKRCGAVIESDQDEAVQHVVEQHGTKWGPYTHNIANLHFISLSQVLVKELESYPTWDNTPKSSRRP